MAISLSSECRIVYLSAGGPANDEELGRALTESVDWDRVLYLAGATKSAGAIDRALSRIGGNGPPDSARNKLRRQKMVSEFHSAYLMQRLSETLRVIRSLDLEVLLLKGSALATSVYDSPVERPMADIDLLIREPQAPAISAALEEAGWIGESNPVKAGVFETHHHLPPFRDSRRSGHHLELHVRPFPPPNPFGDVDQAMWRDASPANIAFAGGLVPSRLHLLLYASVHFAWSHALTSGAWRTMRDVVTLAEKGVDWDALVKEAREWKATSACYWTLRLAGLLSRARVPAEVLAAMRPPMAGFTAAALERHFVGQLVPHERATCPSPRINQMLWRRAISPAWSGHADVTSSDDDAKWAVYARAGAREKSAAAGAAPRSRFAGWRDYLSGMLSDRR